MANNESRPIYTLKKGDLILTVPETGGEKSVYAVDEVELLSNIRLRFVTNDDRTFVCSINHKMCSNGIWRPADSFLIGDVLDGFPPSTIKSIEYLGEGPVVRITVPGANTYLAGNGCWHHNMRSVK